jgi:negative regulator of flagellin synthesis FlgM
MSSTDGIGSLPGASPLVTPASPPAPAGKEQQIKTASAPLAAGSKSSGAIDQTNISSTSELLSAALGVSDVRLDKVVPLQQAIANGSYHVSASDVADKLIATLLK